MLRLRASLSRPFILLSAITIGIVFLLSTPSHACRGDGCDGGDASARFNAHGITVTAYDGGGTAYNYTASDHAAPGARYVWTLIPACPRNSPNGDDLLCYGATVGCPIPGDVHWRIYYRNLDPAVNDQWHLSTTQCLSSNPLLDIAAVKAAVDRLFHQDLPLPGGTLKVQPPNGALVNLPTIFYTTTTEPLHFAVKALGVSVNVTATPSEYVWHFGDGVTSTTTTPGHPHPNEDVTHTFTEPTTLAPYVTVVWSGTYTISGFDQTFVIVGTVSRDGPPLQLPVREARTELVDGT